MHWPEAVPMSDTFASTCLSSLLGVLSLQTTGLNLQALSGLPQCHFFGSNAKYNALPKVKMEIDWNSSYQSTYPIESEITLKNFIACMNIYFFFWMSSL